MEEVSNISISRLDQLRQWWHPPLGSQSVQGCVGWGPCRRQLCERACHWIFWHHLWDLMSWERHPPLRQVKGCAVSHVCRCRADSRPFATWLTWCDRKKLNWRTSWLSLNKSTLVIRKYLCTKTKSDTSPTSSCMTSVSPIKRSSMYRSKCLSRYTLDLRSLGYCSTV